MKSERTALTRGEEEVMRILWKIGGGTVNDVMACMDDPKPKYTTVATFLKLLEDKKFAGHLQKGKVNTYYPLVDEKDYAGTVAGRVIDNFFWGSLLQMVSYFSSEKKLSSKDKEALLRLAQEIMDNDE